MAEPSEHGEGQAGTVLRPGATALVTGASSGIGEALARQLAARGMHLVLVARNQCRLVELAGEFQSSRPDLRVTTLPVDLSLPDAADRVTEGLASGGLTVDVLINNAGVGSHGPFADEEPEVAARIVQLNCLALVALTSRLLPPMVARGRGAVLNVASTAAFQPIPTMAVYAASKAFVLSFSEALWAETRASGVRVCAVCPGPTETAFFAAAAGDKQFLTRGRHSPADVAACALEALESGQAPSVVPGAANRVLASGYRFLPRSLMARMAGYTVRAH